MSSKFYINRLLFLGILIHVLLIVFSISLLQAQESCSNENSFRKQSIQRRYDSAVEALKNKDYYAAEKYLRQVLAEDCRYQELCGKSAWYQLGFVLEKQKEKYQAFKILQQGFDSLAAAGQNDWYLNYDLARLYAEIRIDGSETKIADLIYPLLKNAAPKQHPDLWLRIYNETHILLNKEDRLLFKESLAAPDGTPGLILLSLFMQKDPNPITEENQFLAVFFQRTKEAKDKYTNDLSPRGYDERGEILVRMGSPWKIYRNHSGTIGDVGYAIYPHEIWLYTQLHPDLYFIFIRKPGHSSYILVNGPESAFGTFYRGRRTLFNRRNSGQTAAFLHFNLYQELAPLHETFSRRLSRLSNQSSEEEAADYARKNFKAEDRDHAAQLDTLAPASFFPMDDNYKSLPVKLSLAGFRGASGMTRVEFYYSIPKNDLFFSADKGEFISSLEGEIGIFDKNSSLIKKDSIYHLCNVPSSSETKSGTFISQWNVSLQPDNYSLYFRIENTNGKSLSVIRSDFSVSSFSDTALCLSDIQPAFNIRAKEKSIGFQKHGLTVVPIPENTIQKNMPLYLYYEIYNLTVSDSGKTNYQIIFLIHPPRISKGFFGKILNIFSGKDTSIASIINSRERTGSNRNQFEYDKLDLLKYRSGKFKLKVVIKDLLSGKSVSSIISFRTVE